MIIVLKNKPNSQIVTDLIGSRNICELAQKCTNYQLLSVTVIDGAIACDSEKEVMIGKIECDENNSPFLHIISCEGTCIMTLNKQGEFKEIPANKIQSIYIIYEVSRLLFV
jgi:hypothetical protein